jgi:hypothetical protein
MRTAGSMNEVRSGKQVFLGRPTDRIAFDTERLMTDFRNRGKTRGGTIVRFTLRRESDSLRACRRPTILIACRMPS